MIRIGTNIPVRSMILCTNPRRSLIISSETGIIGIAVLKACGEVGCGESYEDVCGVRVGRAAIHRVLAAAGTAPWVSVSAKEISFESGGGCGLLVS
jgi:hypothetical protein